MILKTILLLERDRLQIISAIHRLARAHRQEKIEAVYFKHMKGNIYIFKNNKTEQHFIQKSGCCHFAEVIYTGLQMKTLDLKRNNSDHTAEVDLFFQSFLPTYLHTEFFQLL